MKRGQLKYQVEKILQEIPSTRNSDIELMIEIWKKFFPQHILSRGNGNFGIDLTSLNHLPREDHIKRYRASFQNDDGLYLPTKLEVVRERRINEEKWRGYMTRNSESQRM